MNVRKQFKSDKPILDPCCGSKMFYFNKNNPHVLFCDNRTINTTLCDGRNLVVAPDIVADFTQLPFEDNSFWHIVFDPPHIQKAGNLSWLVKKYGKLPIDWKTYIKQGFDECWRVLKPNGTLIFKWMEQDITVSEIIKTIERQPVYGHRVGRLNKTHWMAFVKVVSHE